MTLIKFVASLDESSQDRLALTLLERALPIWSSHTEVNALEYIDTVVGMRHVIAKDIISRALNAIRINSKTRISELQHEFMEPMVALRDGDWELPYAVERTFYATSNFLDKLTGDEISEEPLIYVVINQVIDAILTAKLTTTDEMNVFLARFPRTSGPRDDDADGDPLS